MQNHAVRRRTVLAAALAGVTAVTVMTGPAHAAANTGSLSGVVLDTRGEAVPDASIAVYRNGAADPAQEVPADAQGRFALTGLRAGSYRVAIGMGGWSEWAPGRITDVDKAKSYQVRDGRPTTIRSITVTTAGFVDGQILAPDGTPAARASVNLNNTATANSHAASAGADGRYRVRVQPNQTYTMSYAVGPVGQYYPGTFDSSQAKSFTVRSGETVTIDQQALALASASGRLIDADGAPVANASVSFINVSTIAESTVQSEADGSYELRDLLAPGEYKVQFGKAGRSQYSKQQSSYEAADIVTLVSGGTTVLDEQLLWVPSAR